MINCYRWIRQAILTALLTASTALPAAEMPAGWPSKIRIGFIPAEGGADVVQRFKPLVEHIGAQLDIEVEPFSASDYAGLITAMTHQHIDFAYLGPKSYVEAALRANAEALLMQKEKDGAKGYYALLVTRRGSGLDTVEAAINHGKSFCFTDPNSTSGYLVPSVLFYRDLHAAPKTLFKEISFSGSHGASMLAVKNGKVDVAACNTLEMDRMIEKGAVSADDFKIIWRSDLIPGCVLAARRDLPRSLKAAFIGAVTSFNLNKAGLDQMQTAGYEPARDSDYDVIRYLNRLKEKLEQNKPVK